jgi:hypothetical protein
MLEKQQTGECCELQKMCGGPEISAGNRIDEMIDLRSAAIEAHVGRPEEKTEKLRPPRDRSMPVIFGNGVSEALRYIGSRVFGSMLE